jgi:4-diphosphocytidyl-2-C-methyl-D-erythritol kinase
VSSYEAPAKLNLSLYVGLPRSDGFHPLQSMVQTIEWCDSLTFEEGESTDTLDISGGEVEPEDNLVLRAVKSARQKSQFPPQAITLDKQIPVAAGLGGGSSDAAAALIATADPSLPKSDLQKMAAALGADVPLFLVGGTLRMSGVGGVIDPLRPLSGFALAVVVPGFGLSTQDVYKKWDELEGPMGEAISDASLPPALRYEMPMRNDLVPAALKSSRVSVISWPTCGIFGVLRFA